MGQASGTITSCYSTGSVTGSDVVGGLVGNSESTITNCYSTGNVSGHDNVGGLMGQASGTITSCYSTGNVAGNSDVGGLAGVAIAIITSCYSTGSVTGSSDFVGGLLGGALVGTITSCYSTGNVSGVSDVGGLVGFFYVSDGYPGSITDSISYSNVSGQDRVGSFIGNVINTEDGSSFGTLTITNCSALPQNMPAISWCCGEDGNPNTHGLDDMLAGISDTQYRETSLQVGIDSSRYSVITADTGFKKNVLAGLNGLDITRSDAISAIDKVISDITSKQTELGAVQNRLESVLDSITVQYDNLVSARSVIKDADVAKESAAYIKSQILQNASATLLATANQSPSLALTLIGGLRRG